MGTSAIIIVEGHDACKLYKHFDGNPDSTLPWLERFNKDFTDNRGDDPNYKMAQLLRSSARDCDDFGLDDSLYTGWGLVGRHDNYNSNFTYWLNADGTVDWREGSEDRIASAERAERELKEAALFS